jgi:phosphatidylserine/phosphatidylglycerophosphate/cardiolipin synthase-like enzyme
MAAVPPAAEHSLIVEPTDGRALVLAAISGAARSIDLTIYELTDAEVLDALVAAQGRGVTVRVLYNWYSFDSGTQASDVTPYIQRLTAAGVECRPAPNEFAVTHEKAYVVDGAQAIVMTFNLSAEYFESTRDFGIVSTVPTEVAEVEAVFEADWASQPVTPSVATLVWSPTNSRERLLALIDQASHTLEVYNEELSDPGILGALVAAAGRGVSVRVIAAVLESDDVPNGNAQGVTYLQSGGVQAVCKAFPVPTANGSVPIYIHAKVVVADVGTSSASAFIGSENFSCESLNDNRECGILVTETAILARLEATFQSDWAQPSAAVTPDASPLTACPSGSLAARRATGSAPSTGPSARLDGARPR